MPGGETGAMPDPARLAESPVHLPGHALRWTTANVDEGLPGVLTPLTWSMYFPPTESTMRRCWVDMGVMLKADQAIPDDVDGRFFSTAFGHAIANVDHIAQMAARIPGGSAAALEEQLFGAVHGGGLPEPKGFAKVRRWPHVMVKLPGVMRHSMRRHSELAAETAAWWRQRAFETNLSNVDAVAGLVEARKHFEEVLATHMVLSMATQGLMEQVSNLAEKAGDASLAGEVIKAEGGTAEFELVRDLWAMAGNSLDLEVFLERHGYHGPREGLVDSVVWREDSSGVTDLVAAYRSRDHGEDVDQLIARREAEQRDAMTRLLGGIGPLRRPIAKGMVAFAARLPEWRETGRANILQCVDVARAMSRHVGRHLVESKVLGQATDVQFLTIDEIVDHDAGRLSSDQVGQLVQERRADHVAFGELELPHLFHGVPTVTTREAATGGAEAAGAVVEGLGVSGGTVEGIVRVVAELDDVDFASEEDDVVMVCRVTDPSWASLFPLCVAVVTDTGSQMSHAAIVCRELGLPCVANTRDGTLRLRDGLRVRVDGAAGTVIVL